MGNLSKVGHFSNYVVIGPYTGTAGEITFTTAKGCVIKLTSYGSCKMILDANPGIASGQYLIDPDGLATAFAPMKAECDMTTDGGGWTLLSVNGTSFSSPPAQKSTLAGPNDNGYLPRSTVIKIASNSSQVQLRSGNSSSSYANKITSQAGGAAVLALTDSDTTVMGLGTWHRANAVTDFTNNTSIPPVGSWGWIVTCTPTNVQGWPFMYHSCGNGGMVHWCAGYGNRTSSGDPWASTWVR